MDAAVSKLTVPHYYLSVDLNLEALVKLRIALNGNMDADKGVSVLDLLVKAAAAAMKQVPEMNSSWMDGFVRKYNQVDVNVFMGSGEALHAPLVRDAAARGLTAISADLLSAAASPSEIVSGTFSIHNLGIDICTISELNI
jgi:pyruvate dehydrogenase E2 component (dihydrolipoamide acetyltransferase)